MTSRVSSQLLFVSPDNIMRQMVVERDERQISKLFSLVDQQVESASTVFFDGIISLSVYSVLRRVNAHRQTEIAENYQLIDLSSSISSINVGEKPLLFDFGTENVREINVMINQQSEILSGFTLNDILAGCVYYPALLTGNPAVVEAGRQTGLILWENCNLPERKITSLSSIREL